MIQIREVAHQALLDQLLDERLAQPLDVHRAAGGKVLEAAAEPGRARGVIAAPDDLVLVAHQLTAAGAATGGHDPRHRIGRTQAENRRNHARDHIPGFLDHDSVAFPEVLARDVFGVVQRRHRDRRTGEEHRLEDGIGRVRACPSDVDLDLPQLRVRLLRGELEGGGPARKFRSGPEPLSQREVVHLDHHPVGVEIEGLPPVRPSRTEGDDLVDAGTALMVAFHGQTPRRQRRSASLCRCRGGS